jgi:hypothetical protein
MAPNSTSGHEVMTFRKRVSNALRSSASATCSRKRAARARPAAVRCSTCSHARPKSQDTMEKPVIVAAFACAISWNAPAEAQGRTACITPQPQFPLSLSNRLSGDRITKELAGRVVTVHRDNRPGFGYQSRFLVEMRHDGSLRFVGDSKSSPTADWKPTRNLDHRGASGDGDVGTWRVENDLLCHRYLVSRGGYEACFSIHRQGVLWYAKAERNEGCFAGDFSVK